MEFVWAQTGNGRFLAYYGKIILMPEILMGSNSCRFTFKTRQHKARQDNTKQVKTTQSKTNEKNGEGFALFITINIFYVDGGVCGGGGFL